MIALRIKNTKEFMNRLLGSELFDHFLLAEATIRTNVTYEIDGHLNSEFYSVEDKEQMDLVDAEYLPFEMLRGQCLNMIKGKRTPVGFKFSFLLSPSNQANTIARADTVFTVSDVSGMFIRTAYKDGALTATTGIAYRIFSMDHSLDEAWDRFVQQFFYKNGIDVEIL